MAVRPVKAAGDYARGFIFQDGLPIRKEVQELSHTIKHVRHVRDKMATATRASNPNQWEHRGSIPMTVLVDWLHKNQYTMDQWARNDGGTPGVRYPNSTAGVKDKFLAYFMTREFSKLHNDHVTTKRESSQIVVPDNFIGGSHANVRRAESGDS